MLFLPSSVAGRFPLLSSRLVWSLLFSRRSASSSSSSRVKSFEETLIGSDISLFPLVSALRPRPLARPFLILGTLRSTRARRGLRLEYPRKYFCVDATGERNPVPGFLHLFPAARSSISRPPTSRLTPDPFPFGPPRSTGAWSSTVKFSVALFRTFILVRVIRADPRLDIVSAYDVYDFSRDLANVCEFSNAHRSPL